MLGPLFALATAVALAQEPGGWALCQLVSLSPRRLLAIFQREG